MSDSDDLRLNALSRYRKTSPHLALEVHSSCEVPAGCGGVVLRWRKPGAPIGISLRVYVAGGARDMALDGKPLVEQRITLTPGPHVVSFQAEQPGTEGFILMTAELNPTLATATHPTAASAVNGQWKASTRPPLQGWQHPDYLDAGFEPMVALRVPKPVPDSNDWLWRSLQKEATGLGMATPARKAWVRWSFHLDDKGFS
ncbi:hypothetical protein [Comamonas sp. JC664]|uniref:hypothetical protein n=1 Tax=Comamonas sp. JC664 TaxID=2801917 RepID=UPI00174E1BE9|nr:hypothetical protein [Comamonas sp. JC664]MBL0692133.1 hypothetical protein [Comamonas sp. JC664]GHG99515.1 hypothetical protein GCM10012319_65940 [Comamonas sp. KCTC 72670]